MKVLYIINDLDDDGGAQRIVRDLCSVSVGVQAMVLTLRPIPEGTCEQLNAIGVDHSWIRPLDLRRLWEALRMIRAADVLHAHLFPCLYLAALIPRTKLLTEHNTWNRRRSKSWLRPGERFVYRRYNRVVCISAAARRALESWIGDGAPEKTVIDNGVRLDRFTPMVRTAPSTPATLVMIASFTPQKDQLTLIRAMSKLPSSTRLVLVGDGPLREEVEDVVRELGMQGRVRFRGRIPSEEVSALLAEVDICVQSSRWEGFGLVAVEAMASGVPVIATRVPGLAEVVCDPSVLFEAGEANDLAAKAGALLADPCLYAAKSKAAIERSRFYDAKRMAGEYLAVYKELVGAHGRSK